MLRFIVPRIRSSEIALLIGATVLGGLVAGAYGVIHDQITYSISHEYFTKLKFDQFHYADFGLGHRFYAGTIGFLASWWVGAIAAWFLARRLLPVQASESSTLNRPSVFRQIGLGILVMLGVVLLFGVGGYGYGLWRGPDADYGMWLPITQPLGVEDSYSFIRVAYIHNASYLGALVGLIVALLTLRRQDGSSND